jgi:long-chain fatty acid transport protein
LVTKYPSASIARYYALTSELDTTNIGPTIGWQALPQLSFGGGINIEVATAHLSNAVDFGAVGALHGLAPFGLVPGSATGSTTFRGSDTAVGWNVGALYEPWPGTKVGLTYRSAMFHTLTGTINYYSVPAPLVTAFPSQAASAKLPEPNTASLSVAQDIGRWTALASLTYTGWSIFHDLVAYAGTSPISTTMENFHNTVSLALGADYRLNDKLTLRAGTMFDPTPVKDAFRNPRLPDSNRYWLSIGATYRPIPNLALTAAYSHIFADNSTVNQTDAGPGSANFLRGNLAAMYTLSFDIASVEVSYRF